MKLIWHIFKKDLRRMWVPLAVWTALIELQYIVGERLFHVDAIDMGAFTSQQSMLMLVSMLIALIGYTLVGYLVIEDPLVGTRGFWQTRPISGWRLLAGKLLGVAIFFLLWRVAVALPWWIHSGFEPAQVATAADQLIFVQLLFIVPAFVLAAVTGSLARFFLWTLVVLVACIVVFIAWSVSVKTLVPVAPGVLVTRVYLMMVLWPLTLAIVVLLQFATRRTVRSVAVLVTGAVVGTVILLTWPWSWQPENTAPRRQVAGSEGVTVRLAEAHLNANGRDATLALRLDVAGLPKDDVLLPGRLEADFRWPDGTTHHVSRALDALTPGRDLWPPRRLFDLPPPAPDEETAAKLREMVTERRRASGEHDTVVRPEEGNFGGVRIQVSLPLPLAAAERWASLPPACTLHVRLKAGRPYTVFEMPAATGAEQVGGGLRTRLLRVGLEHQGKGEAGGAVLAVDLVSSEPRSMNPVHYFRLNRATDTLEYIGLEGYNFTLQPAQPLQYQRLSLRARLPRVWRTDRWVEDPGWQPGDLIATVSTHTLGNIDRTLTFDRLELTKP